MKKELIENFLKEAGLYVYGFIPCRKFSESEQFFLSRKKANLENEFEESNIAKRIYPRYYMEDGETILSIAFPYYNKEEFDLNGFSIYTKRADYHKVVKSYLDRICAYIECLGGKALGFVDSNVLPERYIAYLAGVGFIGKNNMLITHKYGSYVFLGEIITNLVIDCKEQRTAEEISCHMECGTCRRCLDECPTKSINQGFAHPNICLSYITQKKDITDQEINLLKGNIFGCDFCQLKCPYNENIETTPLKEFKMLDYMNDNVSVFAKMDNRYFKEKIKKTSCGWRGKNVIKRNAIISLYKEGRDIKELEGNSPYLNEYIKRLYDSKES